jgi:DNA-binding transcriptional MerR regulator
MDLSSSNNQRKLLTLKQAAQELEVSIDDLLQWNEFNILKPTITLSGEVGYTQEQIDKFSIINKRKIASVSMDENKSILQSTPQVNEPEVSDLTQPNNKFFPVRLIYPLLAIVVLLIIATTQQGKQISLGGENEAKTSLTLQANSLNSSESASPLVRIKAGIFSNSNENEAPSASAKPMESADVKTQTSNMTNIGNISYSEIANFPKNKDTTTGNLFDKKGNIKGETVNSSVLGMAIGAVGGAQNGNSLRPIADSNILLTILGLGLLYVIFIVRKQLTYSAKLSANVVMPRNFLDNIEKKVLEVNQKTDGTVALYFQGREHKLCKPDLDSESDQFIERLMELAAPGVKEIDYDAVNDQEISFNASLSKLVTRLGFVGIKRDLFFPRTSKSRVLFRRYITEQDLLSMNLTDSDFKQIFQ